MGNLRKNRQYAQAGTLRPAEEIERAKKEATGAADAVYYED